MLYWPYGLYCDARVYRKLSEKYGNLESKLRLSEKIPEIREKINKLIKCAKEVRTSRKAVLERRKYNEEGNNALAEWKQIELAPVKRDLKYTEKELEALRGTAFSLVVNVILESSPEIQEIPFVYYDIPNKKSSSTSATLKLLEIESEPESISRKGVLSYIRKEDRIGIIDSLKIKKRLKHYKALTSGENSRELKLTTFFYEYNNKPIGVGIFLYDPWISLKKGKTYNFARGIQKSIEKVKNELAEVSKKVQREFDKSWIDKPSFDF